MHSIDLYLAFIYPNDHNLLTIPIISVRTTYYVGRKLVKYEIMLSHENLYNTSIITCRLNTIFLILIRYYFKNQLQDEFLEQVGETLEEAVKNVELKGPFNQICGTEV